MQLPSISKSALLLGPCLHWVGPEAKRYDEALTSHEKQTDGTLFHKGAQCQLEGRTLQPVHQPVSVWLKHSAEYIQNDLRPRTEFLRSEQAVGINWLTGDSELGDWPDRSYPERPGWQFGTADLVGVLTTGELYVGDWKTGSSDGAREQLLSLAIALRPHFLKEDGTPRDVVTACLTVNEHGVWTHEETPSEYELLAHLDAMRFVWEDVVAGHQEGRGKRPEHVPGIHCTLLYCPHLGHCEAIGEIVADLGLEDPNGTPPLPVEALMKKLDDMNRGERQAVMSAANRRIKYETEANKKHVQTGGLVDTDTHVWEDRGNGYRWYRK